MLAGHTEIWRAGRPCSELAPDDRGLHYGDGLFETLLVVNGACHWLDLHLQRLVAGASRLAIPLDDSWLRARIDDCLRTVSPAPHVLKLVLTRGSAPRGYRPPRQPSPTLIISLNPVRLPLAADLKTGIRTRLCRQRLAINTSLAGLKHLNRLEQVQACAEWSDPAVREGLMLDSQGALVEATAANLFLVRDGTLQTPLLDRCGVAGVMRRLVMERFAPALGLVCREQRLSLDDLYAADELLLCNSVMGILPVRSVDCLQLEVGPVGQALVAQLAGYRHA